MVRQKRHGRVKLSRRAKNGVSYAVKREVDAVANASSDEPAARPVKRRRRYTKPEAKEPFSLLPYDVLYLLAQLVDPIDLVRLSYVSQPSYELWQSDDLAKSRAMDQKSRFECARAAIMAWLAEQDRLPVELTPLVDDLLTLGRFPSLIACAVGSRVDIDPADLDAALDELADHIDGFLARIEVMLLGCDRCPVMVDAVDLDDVDAARRELRKPHMVWRCRHVGCRRKLLSWPDIIRQGHSASGDTTSWSSYDCELHFRASAPSESLNLYMLIPHIRRPEDAYEPRSLSYYNSRRLVWHLQLWRTWSLVELVSSLGDTTLNGRLVYEAPADYKTPQRMRQLATSTEMVWRCRARGCTKQSTLWTLDEIKAHLKSHARLTAKVPPGHRRLRDGATDIRMRVDEAALIRVLERACEASWRDLPLEARNDALAGGADDSAGL